MKHFARALGLGLLPFVLALGAACDGGGADLPSADEVIGVWVNLDDSVRAFDFAHDAPADAPELAGTPYVYTLYLYPVGSPPVIAQRGHYRIAEGRLVTDVVDSPVDPSLAGQSFGNDIVAWDGDALTLATKTAASGKRTYAAADALP